MLAQKPEVMQCRNNFVTKMYVTPDAQSYVIVLPLAILTHSLHWCSHWMNINSRQKSLHITLEILTHLFFFVTLIFPYHSILLMHITFVLNDSTFIYRRNTERWFNIVGATLPVFKSQFCHLLALYPWASYLTSLCLIFLISKMGIIATSSAYNSAGCVQQPQ